MTTLTYDSALAARDFARCEHNRLARRLGCCGTVAARLGLHLDEDQRAELQASTRRLRDAERALRALRALLNSK